MGLAVLITAGQAPSQPAGTSLSLSSWWKLRYSSCLQEENPRAIFTGDVHAQSGWSAREEGGKDCSHMWSHCFARNTSCCKPKLKIQSRLLPSFLSFHSQSLLNTHQPQPEPVTYPAQAAQQHSPSSQGRIRVETQAKPYVAC